MAKKKGTGRNPGGERARGANPGGRLQGTLNKRTLIFRELMGQEGLLAEGLVTLIVDVIKKGELPGRVHPFYSHLKFMDKQINGRRKHRKAPTVEQWELIMDESERLLVHEQVTTSDRLSLIRDVIGYIFPRLKAIEHTIQAGGAQQYGVLLLATPQDRDEWEALAKAQQIEAIKKAASKAKDVSGA